MTDIPKDELELAKRIQTREASRPPQPWTKIPGFDAMTQPEKAVAVARDVIRWLESGKLVAKPGTYLSIVGLPDEPSPHGSVPKVNGYSCRACALGAVLACTVEQTDTFDLLNPVQVKHGFQGGAWKLLSEHGVFDPWDLALMETAFEQCFAFADTREFHVNKDAFGDGSLPEDKRGQAERAYNFGLGITTSWVGVAWPGADPVDALVREEREPATRRLRAIMQNVIDNGGTFKP